MAGTKLPERVWFGAMEGEGVWKRIVAYLHVRHHEVYILKAAEAEP
jgi:hypothetical protein